MSNERMALMEEAQCEVIKGGERYMTNEITKDGDVTETRKREKTQEIQAKIYCMANILMLINFRFAFVTGKLIFLYADEDEPIDKLSVGQMEKELVCSMKSEHMLEYLLQTKCWKTWLKGLFKMRTLPKFTLWVSAKILRKNIREEAHG